MKKEQILGTIKIYKTTPKGWHVIVGATTAPNGYQFIANGKSRFSPEKKRRVGLIKTY